MDMRNSLNHNDHKKPETERNISTKTRPCLVCEAPFLSEWAGERICRRCKSKTAWRGRVRSYPRSTG